MNDTTRRFLSAIVERVPTGGEIVELRLFPAIRQGGIESGVAVVAVQLPEADSVGARDASPVPVDAAESVDATIPLAATIPPAVHDLVDTDVAVEDEEGAGGDDHPVPVSFIPLADTTGEHEVADALDEELTEIVVSVERDVSAQAVDDLQRPEEGESIALEDILALQSPSMVAEDGAVATDDTAGAGATHSTDEAPAVAPDITTDVAPHVAIALPRRYAVLTARYRLAIKGPDRGKWDVEITHEADAPLETVERVARGVAKRAGEASDPEHFSGESLRAALEAPVWATTP